MNIKRSLLGITSFMIISFLVLCFIFYLNWNYMILTFITTEGSLIVIIVICIRMILFLGIGVYLLHIWLGNEEKYYSDIPFLFSLFFLAVVIGKIIDLFYYFMYFHYPTNLFLLTVKIRFVWAVISYLPIYYSTFEIFLTRISGIRFFSKLQNANFLQKTKRRLIPIIFSVELCIVIIIPNINIFQIVYPLLQLTTVGFIAWIFFIAFRLNRLQKLKPFVLFIGFTAYLITSIIRLFCYIIFGQGVMYVFVSELIDLPVSLIILYGLIERKR